MYRLKSASAQLPPSFPCCRRLRAESAAAGGGGTGHHAKRVILFVWDGMRPDSITEADTPNLAALKRDGTFFSDNHSSYPTFTMMNAAAFATGSFSGKSGFYGNSLWRPGAPARIRRATWWT